MLLLNRNRGAVKECDGRGRADIEGFNAMLMRDEDPLISHCTKGGRDAAAFVAERECESLRTMGQVLQGRCAAFLRIGDQQERTEGTEPIRCDVSKHRKAGQGAGSGAHNLRAKGVRRPWR